MCVVVVNARVYVYILREILNGVLVDNLRSCDRYKENIFLFPKWRNQKDDEKRINNKEKKTMMK